MPVPSDTQQNNTFSTQHSALSTPDVSIIIVSYNVAGLLEECLTSLFSRPADGLAIEVIVVDNASSDLVNFQEKFPVRQIENRYNYGFPRACNQGLRQAHGRYLFFLNPDATVEPGALRTLVDFMEAHPQAGIVGPKLRFPDGKSQSNRRRFPGPGLALVESTLLQYHPRSPFKNLPALKKFYFEGEPDGRTQQVDWLVGAAFMVRREVVEQLGGLDERFFMYFEETDFCHRAKNQGWQVWYVPEAVVTHQEGQSSKQNVAARAINFNTSKISYYRKYYGRAYAAFLRGFLLGTHLLEYAEQWAKLKLGHKAAFRREHLQRLGQIMASRFRPYRSSYPHAAADLDLCLLTAEYPPQPGGVGDYTACLKAALEEAGIGSARVFTAEDAGDAEERREKSKIVNRKSLIGNRNWGWRVLPLIARDLKARPAQVVNIQYQTGAYGMHPAVNLLPLYLRLKLGAERPRVVTTFHDLLVPYLFPKAGPVREWINRLLVKTSDAAIVTNEADYQKALEWGANPARLWLVPIGSNITPGPGFVSEAERNEYRAKLGLAKSDFAVGYFGLTNRSKGVDILLEALARLRQQEPGWKLVIIGGEVGETDRTNREYARELAALSEKLNLETDIIRTGHLSPEETSRTLFALDAVALPFRDGASFRRGSLLAPLAHGLPVITTEGQFSKIGANGPQLISGRNVVQVESENPEALVSALEKVRHDAGLKEKLSAGALDLSRHFEWDSIAARMQEIYLNKSKESEA